MKVESPKNQFIDFNDGGEDSLEVQQASEVTITQELISSHVKSKELDSAFKQAIAEWLVSFNEDSDIEAELNEILGSNPYSKESREHCLWQLYSLMEDKLEVFKLKLVTTKF